jgi:hypothetical protein
MKTTIAPIEQEIGPAIPLQAKWVRIPDAVRLSGMSRRTLYDLIGTNKIRSVCVRPSAGQKGVRLIHAQSLNDFIASFETSYDQSVPGKVKKAEAAVGHDLGTL